jgi:BarA-like signal transduction histidine kinase
MQKQGMKVGFKGFAALKKKPHRRADMIALLQALDLANATVKNSWPQNAATTTVVIMLGRPCKELMDIIIHHIEHGPESYKSLQAPHRSTVK